MFKFVAGEKLKALDGVMIGNDGKLYKVVTIDYANANTFTMPLSADEGEVVFIPSGGESE